MFTEFQIPIERDQHGGITTKAVVVQDELLPVMADIIGKASRPVLLTKTTEIRVTSHDVTEQLLTHLREGAELELRYKLFEHAREHGFAIITEPKFEESIDGIGVEFRMTATAMPLLEKGLDR